MWVNIFNIKQVYHNIHTTPSTEKFTIKLYCLKYIVIGFTSDCSLARDLSNSQMSQSQHDLCTYRVITVEVLKCGSNNNLKRSETIILRFSVPCLVIVLPVVRGHCSITESNGYFHGCIALHRQTAGFWRCCSLVLVVNNISILSLLIEAHFRGCVLLQLHSVCI